MLLLRNPRKTTLRIALCLIASTSVSAQTTVKPDGTGGYVIEDKSGCGALWGYAKGQCMAQQEALQKQQAQQAQLLEQQQLENLKLQNEILTKKLEQEHSEAAKTQVEQGSESKFLTDPAFADWLVSNRWFGVDRPRTEYAVLYAKQLKSDQPDLAGRQFLDAISKKVNDVFSASK